MGARVVFEGRECGLLTATFANITFQVEDFWQKGVKIWIFVIYFVPLYARKYTLMWRTANIVG